MGWGYIMELGFLQTRYLGGGEGDSVPDVIAFNRGTEAAEVPTENKIIEAFGIHNKHRDNMT